ncbi:hypothetical protein CLOBOL_07066 [Enterocloster bolteae ATCC BAA-613]|uniref:Uncharacterized protein n=1 Tax=Enterocloster bolteae (strain ATCC BAA-613 / DSM 15670 / CCUG 46953 / JCM 12243 / WAL 16351) TaxID=411902 RepID=A8S4T1_ENTBW|nr:hypothetical protein CLOBOL_07066 [Enterocloster bolteae ATCC BAA-613]
MNPHHPEPQSGAFPYLPQLPFSLYGTKKPPAHTDKRLKEFRR